MTGASPRRARRTLAAIVVAVLAGLVPPSPLAAQHTGHGPPSSGTTAMRLGTVAFANSGSEAAKPAFLRGLALLHNFEYPRAAAAFREAQRLDSGFAMAYWGEAMTYNHGIWREQDSVAARAVLARLGATLDDRLAKAPTAREQDYLRTLDALYSHDGTKPGRDSAYAAASEQLARRWADDADAQLFYALALLSLFPRTDATYERAGAIAERVMRDFPAHPGALHYVIHAYDDPAHAQRGLAAARTYAKVATGAEHAMHMTSHIFIALGMWDDVVAANEAASPDARKFGVGAPPDCSHYGIWLQYAYLQQGRLGDARRMTEACRTASAKSTGAAFGFEQMRATYLIETDDPAREAPSARQVIALTGSGHPPPPVVAMLEAIQGAGTAYIGLRHGDTLAARAPRKRIRDLTASFGGTPMGQQMPEMAGAWEATEHEFDALLALRRGAREDAENLLRKAAAREEALPFSFGPPVVDKPPRELLGEVLLALGRPAEARREFELALARTPGRSLTLLGLARASRAAGDSATASATYRQLLTNWRRADAGFPGVREARAALSSTDSAR